MSLIEYEGWWRPDKDQVCVPIVLQQVKDLERMIPLCKQHRRVVQAGGNVGIWPERLSRAFDFVETFEPDPANYEALIKNVGWRTNIYTHNCALGDERSRGAMDHVDPQNIGAHRIKHGDEFDILKIDDFGFNDVDFIQFDVEGFEHFAILGSLETIRKTSPLICLELKGIGERYGHPDEDTIKLLESEGYRIKDRIHRDIVFYKD